MQELSVTALIRYLKNRLDTDNNLQRVVVVGEISNFHHHYSGHLYFTLKDENAQISCVMFKSSATSLKFEPKTGDKVLVKANTSIFESSGQLQLYVLNMSLYGLGDLYAQYEALKNKLEEDGYFDESHKKKFKKEYIDNVAVLVGDKSAAMSDIKTTFNRRWPLCNVDYYPVLVQGEGAPASIIENLLTVDSLDYDVIILARGGGSFEDLFCFNNEALVKCIYNLKTFIITGVGHERDFTLVDYVSDLRAPTPTASVELITPNIYDVYAKLDVLNETLNSNIEYIYEFKSQKLDNLLDDLLKYQEKLKNISNTIDLKVNGIKKAILNNIAIYNQNITNLGIIIKSKVDNSLLDKQLTYKRLNTLLEAYSGQNVLKRGYSLIIQDEKVVKKKQDLKDSEFEVKFIDGSINAIKR